MPVHIAVLPIGFLAGACSGVVGFRVGYCSVPIRPAMDVGGVVSASLGPLAVLLLPSFICMR